MQQNNSKEIQRKVRLRVEGAPPRIALKMEISPIPINRICTNQNLSLK